VDSAQGRRRPTLEFRSCAIAFASFTERRCPVVPAGDGRTRELEQALVDFSGGGVKNNNQSSASGSGSEENDGDDGSNNNQVGSIQSVTLVIAQQQQAAKVLFIFNSFIYLIYFYSYSYFIILTFFYIHFINGNLNHFMLKIFKRLNC
jgi:hypothetical protein